jgi:thymidylate synthase
VADLNCLEPGEAILRGIMLARSGETTSPRGLTTHEVRYPTILIQYPWLLPPTIPGRKAKWAIGAIEACSLVGQVSVPEWLTERVAAFDRFEEDGVFWGAYGTRIAGQLGLALDTLAGDRDSRQAVVTVFDGHRDLSRTAADIPCTVAFQFMIRSDRMEMRTVMRSNDAWLGLTYDVVQFIALQGAMAQAMDVPMGPYIHQPGSLHLYATHDAHADRADVGYEPPDFGPYVPLWGGTGGIDETSRRARMIGAGQKVPLPTRFESWLMKEING